MRYKVRIEPLLQKLKDEQFHQRTTNIFNGARLGVAAKGFWAAGQEISSQMLSGMLTKSLTILCFERE